MCSLGWPLLSVSREEEILLQLIGLESSEGNNIIAILLHGPTTSQLLNTYIWRFLKGRIPTTLHILQASLIKTLRKKFVTQRITMWIWSMGPLGTIHNPVDGGHATHNCYKIEPGMTFLPAVMIPNRIWLNQWAVQKEIILQTYIRYIIIPVQANWTHPQANHRYLI